MHFLFERKILLIAAPFESNPGSRHETLAESPVPVVEESPHEAQEAVDESQEQVPEEPLQVQAWHTAAWCMPCALVFTSYRQEPPAVEPEIPQPPSEPAPPPAHERAKQASKASSWIRHFELP